MEKESVRHLKTASRHSEWIAWPQVDAWMRVAPWRDHMRSCTGKRIGRGSCPCSRAEGTYMGTQPSCGV